MDSGVTTSNIVKVESGERLSEAGWEEGAAGTGEEEPEEGGSSRVTSRGDADAALDDGVDSLGSADPVERYQ